MAEGLDEIFDRVEKEKEQGNREEHLKEKIEAEEQVSQISKEEKVRRLKAKGFAISDIAQRQKISEEEVTKIIEAAYKKITTEHTYEESIEAYGEMQRELAMINAMEMSKKNFACPHCKKHIGGLKVDNQMIINANKMKMELQEKKIELAKKLKNPKSLKQF